MRIVRASVAVEPRQPPLKTDSEGICHGVSSDRFPERSRVAPERRGRSLPPVRQFLSAPARLYAPNRYRHWRIPVGVRRLPPRRWCVLCLAAKATGAGPAVYRQGGNAEILGQSRYADRVALLGRPTGAYFQGDRHVNGRYHGGENFGHSCFVLQQG